MKKVCGLTKIIQNIFDATCGQLRQNVESRFYTNFLVQKQYKAKLLVQKSFAFKFCAKGAYI
jgi:hypothetical protein